MRNTWIVFKLLFCVLFLMILWGVALLFQQSRSVYTKSTRVQEEAFVSVTTREGSEATQEVDYREYLPVFQNGEEINIYDLIDDEQILYLKRDGCEDCEKYDELISKTLYEMGDSYLVLEVSKDPQSYSDGYAVSSAVVKSIGISQVPALAWIKDGRWMKKMENDDFAMGGTEIVSVTNQVFD